MSGPMERIGGEPGAFIPVEVRTTVYGKEGFPQQEPPCLPAFSALFPVPTQGQPLDFPELRKKREIVFSALFLNLPIFTRGDWGEIVIPDELKKDPEIVLAIVQRDGRALRGADQTELKKYPEKYLEIVLAAVQQNGRALYCADPELQRDPKILAIAREHGFPG